MKVVMTDMLETIDELRSSYPEVTFQVATSVDEQTVQIRDADAYVGWPPQEVFIANERLRWVHVGSTGIDMGRTRVPALMESDVVLTNTRGPREPHGGPCVWDDPEPCPALPRVQGRPAGPPVVGRTQRPDGGFERSQHGYPGPG